jgi:transcriptional regulator GlxA family with amidase domain
MSYASAVEPLRAANRLSGKSFYRWWNAAPGDRPALASNGTAILPDFGFGTDDPELDVLFVCAGGDPAAYRERRTLAWLRRLARAGTVVGGVSGGPFILARAGLLSGRRCTVHWEHAPAFEEAFPDVTLTRSLFEIEGDRLTCSGGISALDMMVALIARDHGRRLANAVSDWFLHTHVREGINPQRMDLGSRFGIADANLLRVLEAMELQLETPMPRERLAALAGVSVRQLERKFRLHVGRGIHAHYLTVRLARARQLLRESSASVLDIALATGFTSASQFSRAYRHCFGQSPKKRFP